MRCAREMLSQHGANPLDRCDQPVRHPPRLELGQHRRQRLAPHFSRDFGGNRRVGHDLGAALREREVDQDSGPPGGALLGTDPEAGQCPRADPGMAHRPRHQRETQRTPLQQQPGRRELDRRDQCSHPEQARGMPFLRPCPGLPVVKPEVEVRELGQRQQRGQRHHCRPCQRDIAVIVRLRGQDRHDLAGAVRFGGGDRGADPVALGFGHRGECCHRLRPTSCPKRRRRRSCRRRPKIRRRRPSRSRHRRPSRPRRHDRPCGSARRTRSADPARCRHCSCAHR